MPGVLTIVLAGGRGQRLEPLTRDRAKPAVPFGGIYRIIDFPLSNCINSQLRRVLILTQYKAISLDRHINLGWRFLNWELNEYIDVIPPQQRIDEHWYQGTADAVYQNIYSIEKEQPDLVLVLAGDHVYKMNYAHMIRDHLLKQADLTIATIPIKCREAAGRLGVLQVDHNDRVVDFQEKPEVPPPLPEDPTRCLASMGIYVFSAQVLFEKLCADATASDSSHDFGKDIIPSMIPRHGVYSYPFVDENTHETLYWRDIGTLDSYYRTNMDLVAVSPVLNLYDQAWPVRTYQPSMPPPKFVFADPGDGARRGEALDSMVSPGCVVSGGRISRCVLSPDVRINSFAKVEESILFDRVEVGRHAKVRRAIIDKGVVIPPGEQIGYDVVKDRARFKVTDDGVVVIAKHETIERS